MASILVGEGRIFMESWKIILIIVASFLGIRGIVKGVFLAIGEGSSISDYIIFFFVGFLKGITLQ